MKKIEKKKYSLKTWEANGCIFIEEKNPVNEILIKQSKFITTKNDREQHGLGLTCVKEAMKRYEGTCKFFIEEKII